MTKDTVKLKIFLYDSSWYDISSAHHWKVIAIPHYSDVMMSEMASQITSLNRSFRRRSKNTSKFCVAGLCAGNSPVTGEFPAQMASDAEMFPSWLPQ